MATAVRTPRRGYCDWRSAMALAAALLAVAAPVQSDSHEPPAAYRLGIFPYLSPRNIVEQWGPVSASMSAALGAPVRLESSASFSSFTNGIANQIYDIALIQPFDYAEAVDKHGYVPLARLSVPLVTQFFVRGDSRYQKLSDLRGTTVALPPAASANARMALRALQDYHLVPGRDLEVRYFNAHDSCIQQVWVGTASACATTTPPIASFEQRMHARLRSIHDTAPIPHVLFVAHPRVPPAQREVLRKLILGWSENDEGRALLKSVNFPGFAPIRAGEYAVMRHYNAPASASSAAANSDHDLALGVFPYLSPRMLTDQLAPLPPALAAVTGNGVQLRTASSYGAFLDNIAAGRYDIVAVQPFDYRNVVRQGYLPLVRMSGELEGHVYVRTDSPLRHFADLKGQRVAMPPYESAMSRLGRARLHEAGLVPGRDLAIDYRPTHDSCLQQVQQGLAVACMTSTHAVGAVPRELSKDLRSIALLGRIPGVVFVAHRRVPQKVRARVRDEMLSWGSSASGRRLIDAIHLGPFEPVNPDDYESLPQAEETP